MTLLPVLLIIGSVAAPLPEFFSSDAEHDALLEDLFLRHSRIEMADDSLRRAEKTVVPGIGTCMLWRDYEIDQFYWHDASQANYPHEDRAGGLRWMLETIPVDSFGYVFTAHNGATPGTMGPHVFFGMGWPFPQYPLALGGKSRGWEWNGDTTEGWTATGVEKSEVANGYWNVATSGVDPQLISPEMEADSFHAPFIEIELAYNGIDGEATNAERTFEVYWATKETPGFSPERCVRSDTWPVIPVEGITEGFNRRVWLPMYLHSEWNGHTITQLRIDPIGSRTKDAEGQLIPRSAQVAINCLRLNYDTRHAINNPTFVRACARKFFWDGDEKWLKGQLSRMRMATEFMLSHLQGRERGFLDQTFLVGHDGLGWKSKEERRVGHGIGTNYYDLLPMGPRDLQSTVKFYQALEAMVHIEDYIESHPELDSPKPAVRAPDGVGKVRYTETARSLNGLVAKSHGAIQKEFWAKKPGRFGGWRNVNGELKDYGFTHFNLEMLEADIASKAQAKSVLDWMDGDREVEGDTSTGDDINRWEFAPRMTTRKNDLDYFWGWSGHSVAWGDQVQDGGATMFTSFYDVKGRLEYGDVGGAWACWKRILDHHAKMIADGGEGKRFYRDYYEADRSRGTLQGGGTAGGLGLDEEFVESLLVPTAWATAWVGIDAPEAGIFEVAPTLPPGLDHIGVRNVVYRGNRIAVRAEENVIDLRGSDIAHGEAGRLRLVFRGVLGDVVLRNGEPDTDGSAVAVDGGLVWETTLGADRFEVVAMR